ncbi:Chorion peroxidase [Nymphon striatum]|nr:Chorion peroxidase [Nymphon striatum]
MMYFSQMLNYQRFNLAVSQRHLYTHHLTRYPIKVRTCRVKEKNNLQELSAWLMEAYLFTPACIKLSFASVLLLGVLISISEQFTVSDKDGAATIALYKLGNRAKMEEQLLGAAPSSIAFGPNVGSTAGEYILYFMQAVCKIQSCSSSDVEDFSNLPLDLNMTGFDTFSQHCRDEIDCSSMSKKYRTIDGTCNNLKNKRSLYGSVGTPLERFLPAAYSDYISEPRKYGKNGDMLAPARFISERVLPDVKILNDKMTTMMVYYGQLIAHDFVQTDIIKLDGENVPCCSGLTYDGCVEMPVTACDTFYSQFGRDCISLARSKATVSSDCKFGKREQENIITTFMDASFMYGSSDDLATSLRKPIKGKLIKSPGQLLPIDKVNGCTFQDKNCNFVAVVHLSSVPLATLHCLLPSSLAISNKSY